MQVRTQITTLPAWLKLLYPFRTSSLAVGSERMSFVNEGDPSSPPLVLVHGSPAWSLLWRHIVPEVSGRFHVVAPDNVGFGLSSKPDDPGYHTLERHIDNLTALMEELRLKQITLVLNGWGGPIGLGYAVRFPEFVSRIILMNTWVGPWSAIHQSWTLRFIASRLGSAMAFNTGAVRSMGMKLVTRKPLPENTLRGYLHPFSRRDERDGLLAFYRMRAAKSGDPEFDTLARIAGSLPTLQMPVEILWGVHDRLLPGKALPYLLRDQFANAQAPKLLPECGHLVPEEDPAAVIEKILEVFQPKAKPAVFNILR